VVVFIPAMSWMAIQYMWPRDIPATANSLYVNKSVRNHTDVRDSLRLFFPSLFSQSPFLCALRAGPERGMCLVLCNVMMTLLEALRCGARWVSHVWEVHESRKFLASLKWPWKTRNMDLDSTRA
jgi:hypothetical protein